MQTIDFDIAWAQPQICLQGAAGEMRKMTFSDIYNINTQATCFFTTFINNFNTLTHLRCF